MSATLFSLAFGVGTQNRQGDWLEVFYAQPLLQPAGELVDAIAPLLGYAGGNQAIAITTTQAAQLADALKPLDTAQHALLTRLAESQRPLVVTLLAEDAALTSTPEAYLKLHLISHRLVKPHGLNLTGIFPLLPNVAWTNQGAVDLAELAERRLAAHAGVRAVLKHEDLAPCRGDLAQEAGHHGVPQFDGLRLGLGGIDSGLGEFDSCHDDSSESPVSKSRMGATRGEAGSSFGKHRHMLNSPK